MDCPWTNHVPSTITIRIFRKNRENRQKRALGAAPMTDNSQYSGSKQAGGTLAAVQSFRAVGAAAAAQRARSHCDSAFYFGWGYENLT